MISPDYTLRVFGLEDYDAALALWRITPGVHVSVGDSRADLSRYLMRNAGLSAVIEHAGAIVGTLLAGHDGRRGVLYHLAVAPAHQRRGLARALVEFSLERLRAEGIERTLALVLDDNADGRAFWEKLSAEHLEDVVVMAINR
jgi:ribosomal protein S18 acetylase RimI-like enzyme